MAHRNDPNRMYNGDSRSPNLNGYVEVPRPAPPAPGTPMKSLQSEEEKKLFDIVDKIRSFDVNHELDLPQLVVCGSQSSGKSSVLEAISGYPFPRAEMTCTRFVTEVSFRRDKTRSITVTITPDKARNPQERARLEAVRFNSIDDNLKALPELIRHAEQQMGIGSNKAFSKDILRVQIWGPDHQPLTLVDLPGIIEAHSNGKENIEMIKSIVQEWISEKRSIILAVVEASNDAQKQGVLQMAREVDPSGDRTFGIITKPDLAQTGSKLENYWIEYAQNSPRNNVEFQFRRGWHVLMNRSFQDLDDRTSSEVRDKKEREFFSNPNSKWSSVDPAYWGIESLRDRLRKLLFEHTKRQLPQVRRDIMTKLDRYNSQLSVVKAGLQAPAKMWADFQHQTKVMVQVATKGVDGKYNDAFFRNHDEDPERYLRSRIEEENDIFNQELTSNGHGIPFLSPSGTWRSDTPKLVEVVESLLKKTVGEELNGHVDPQRMDFLFWEHSKLWHGIAFNHVERAHDHCLSFIEHVVSMHMQRKLPHIPSSVWARMTDELRESLRRQSDQAKEELAKLEHDRLRSTKTRNKSFARRAQQNRNAKLHNLVCHALDADNEALTDPENRTARVTPAYLARMVGQETSRSMAEDLASDMMIYYEIARDVFVDNVIIQVIERNLLANLHELFYSDFGIDRDTFEQLLNNDDHRAREAEKRILEDRIRALLACYEGLL